MSGRKKGAKSIAPEKRKIGRQISMNDQDWQELDQLAEGLGVSRSALIRMAIKKFRKKNSTNPDNNN